MIARRMTCLLFLALGVVGCVAVDDGKRGRYGEGSRPSAHDSSRKGWPANPEFQRSRIEVAVQEVEVLLQRGKFSDARRRLDELPPLDLEDGRIHLLYARIAMAEGQPQDVEWHLGEASLLMPKNGQVDLMRATFREVFGDWSAARDAYAEAAVKMPDHMESITAQARVLLAMGSSEKALELLEHEMARRPLSGELLRTAGFVKLSIGKFDEAASDFRDAQDLLSPDGASLETMYLAMARAGRYDDVVALVRDLDIGAMTPLAQYTVGHSAPLADEPGLAVEAFQHWITHDRGNPDSWLDLARAHFLDGQYEAAFEAVSKVLHVRPDHVDSLVLLGHIRSRVGQFAAAMATYREAARLGADGVDLAPVMLRLVDAMETGVPMGARGSSVASSKPRHEPKKVVSFGGPQYASESVPSTVGSPSGAAPHPMGAQADEAPVDVDRLALAELMAGTRRDGGSKVSNTPEPVAPAVVEPARLLPDLPDAGPAPEEVLYGLEGLEMPLAAMGVGEKTGEG